MKLQKHMTKKGTDYFKWEIIIPNDIIEKADLKEGDEFECEVRKGEIKLRKN